MRFLRVLGSLSRVAVRAAPAVSVAALSCRQQQDVSLCAPGSRVLGAGADNQTSEVTHAVVKKGAWTKAALEQKANEKAAYWQRVRELRDWACAQGLGARAALTRADPKLSEGICCSSLHRALSGQVKSVDGRSEKDILTMVEEAKVVEWLKSSARNCGSVKEQQLCDGQKELSAEVKKLLRLRLRANKSVNNSARFGAIPLTKAEEKLLGQEGLSHVWRPPWVHCWHLICDLPCGQDVPLWRAAAP